MAKKSDFPKECCGVCKYSHDENKTLYCFANPPLPYYDEGGEELHSRGYDVEPTDPPCHLFKGREHA
jgi:hypothetical protein